MNPHSAGAIVIAVCLLIAVGIVVAGLARVVPRAQRLKGRLASYRSLPILGEIDRAQGRIDDIRRDAAAFGPLLERARVAVLELMAARNRLARQAAALGAAARFVNQMLFPTARDARRSRTPES